MNELTPNLGKWLALSHKNLRFSETAAGGPGRPHLGRSPLPFRPLTHRNAPLLSPLSAASPRPPARPPAALRPRLLCRALREPLPPAFPGSSTLPRRRREGRGQPTSGPVLLAGLPPRPGAGGAGSSRCPGPGRRKRDDRGTRLPRRHTRKRRDPAATAGRSGAERGQPSTEAGREPREGGGWPVRSGTRVFVAGAFRPG